ELLSPLRAVRWRAQEPLLSASKRSAALRCGAFHLPPHRAASEFGAPLSAARRTWVISRKDQPHVHQLVRSFTKRNRAVSWRRAQRKEAPMAIKYAKLFKRRSTPQAQPIT